MLKRMSTSGTVSGELEISASSVTAPPATGRLLLLTRWRLHRLFGYALAFALMFSLVMVLDLHKQNSENRDVLAPVPVSPAEGDGLHNLTASSSINSTVIPLDQKNANKNNNDTKQTIPEPQPEHNQNSDDQVDPDTQKLYTQEELGLELLELVDDFDMNDAAAERGTGESAGQKNEADDKQNNSDAREAREDSPESLEDAFLRSTKSVRSLRSKLSAEEYDSFLALELQAMRGACDSSDTSISGNFKNLIDMDDSIEVEQDTPLWGRWCTHRELSRPDAMRMLVSKTKNLLEMIEDGSKPAQEQENSK